MSSAPLISAAVSASTDLNATPPLTPRQWLDKSITKLFQGTLAVGLGTMATGLIALEGGIESWKTLGILSLATGPITVLGIVFCCQGISGVCSVESGYAKV